MIDWRKLKAGDRVSVSKKSGWAYSADSNTYAPQIIYTRPATVTGIGKPRGRSGQKTLVYVELDGDGVRAAFPIDSIRFIE
ncbi:MAG TPA: hypothetical protein VN742_00225 [Candidatus Binataceae bacterium]|jgi:hypothetical protein|nr:hypothetical protein [Candidatus Binataceae bacterium]